MYMDADTIVASATPAAESALAIIRLSGPACARLSALFAGGRPVEERKSFYGAYRTLDGQVLDRCVFLPYAEGASYTGEAMLEINCHGNPLIVRQVIDDLLARGCRAAQAGEFTRRAFLNGRMDLTQAEAVQDIISARSESALEAARRQLDGSVGKAVNALLERLLRILAYTEAYIDFPEEDLPPESSEGPVAQLIALQNDAKSLIATAPYSAMLREGACTVIAGLPNAGKSSLLNVLLGEDRAIVSAEPGTTRDYIEARLLVGRHLLRVVDTAGLREGGCEVEHKGIEKSLAQIGRADLVLLVVDSTLAPPTLPFRVETLRKSAGLIIVENKCDLPASADLSAWMPQTRHVRISALDARGIDALRGEITAALDATYKAPGQDEVLVGARHAGALRVMSDNIALAIDKMRDGEPPELAASDLRAALGALEEIVGRVDSERVLDLVFSTFCIGK
jgi:tRNA modification GTPase